MAFVQVPPNSTGEKIDLRQLADGGGNTVDRQVINIGDVSTFGQVAAVTAGNALKVDNSAVTQPISGTITATQGTAAAAAGSWPVEVTDGTNVLGTSTHPVRNDPTGTTTQPVSGTVTANIGTSGSLALDASVTGLQVAQGSTTSGQNGDLVQGAVTTNAPTYTTAKTDPLSLDTSGNLRVSVKDSPANTNAFKVDGSGVTQPVSGTVATTQSGTWTVQPGNTANTTAWKVDGSAVTQPVSGTVTTTPPSNASTNVAQLAGTATSVNSGVKDAGTLRVVLATDQPALTNKILVTPDSVALPANQSVNNAQINGVTPLMGNGTTGTGSQRVTIASDNTAFSVNAVESGTWTVQPGNTANTTPWLVQSVPATSGGTGAPFSASLTSTKQAVKASAGTLYGYEIVNNGSALCYVQVFNLASASVTVGTTAPTWVIPVPAPSSGTAGAGLVHELDKGYSFSTALTIACTTTRTGSTSATCDVNFFFD